MQQGKYQYVAGIRMQIERLGNSHQAFTATMVYGRIPQAMEDKESDLNMDKVTIITEMRRVAAEIGTKVLPMSEFQSRTGLSGWQIYKHFASWNEAVEAADLTPTHTGRIDDAELFREMKDVFMELGGVCTWRKFNHLCKYSLNVYRRHFGKWKTTLLAFKAWIIESGEDFPFLDQLPSEVSLRKAEERIVIEKEELKAASWSPLGTMTYGAFLNFRGLQHAPVNEQGVVFLFGMVCYELGFVVEAVRTSYPDCEAKRRVKGKPNTWERVRIEFEYFSSHFRNHGHDPNGCDVIVCWQNDWPECPLEVIELKTAIQTLPD